MKVRDLANAETNSRVRYLIVAILFAASCFSYGDRVALSIAGTRMSADLHLSPLKLGYLLSGFSWAYVIGQLPSGGLLDRYGAKRVYGIAMIAWSACAFMTAFVGYLPIALAFSAIFLLRFLSGLAQSPVFPGNGRIVASWFPTAERGTASAIFNASQYFALVVFAPIFGSILHFSGWQGCFFFMTVVGAALTIVWFKNIHSVRGHRRISAAEISHIEDGGGLVLAENGNASGIRPKIFTLSGAKLLLQQRMLVGVYLGQYFITTLTWFFLTWFPIYLLEARHMSIVKVGFAAAVPALCGAAGGVLGGLFSDKLIDRGFSLTVARKTPIIAGMLLSTTIIACNYARTQSMMLAFMSLAFFGKGFGALGWTVIADTSPRTMVGLNGGLFNLIGNLAGITTPIIIGYIVQRTHSFDGALLFVAVTALCAIVSYGPLVGEIKRVELEPAESSS